MSIFNAVFLFYCRQSMVIQIFLVFFVIVYAETNKESCNDMLQGYLTGQLSSALGAYQVEALKQEFASFSIEVKKSIKEVKETQETDKKWIQGLKLKYKMQ